MGLISENRQRRDFDDKHDTISATSSSFPRVFPLG